MSDAQPPRQTIRTLQARKRIALIAHDGKKTEMLEWATRWKDTLSQHELIGTGTTSKRLKAALGLEVEGLMSGPLGGDQQIGARIAEQRLDILIFFGTPSRLSLMIRMSKRCCVWRRCGMCRLLAMRPPPTSCFHRLT